MPRSGKLCETAVVRGTVFFPRKFLEASKSGKVETVVALHIRAICAALLLGATPMKRLCKVATTSDLQHLGKQWMEHQV